MVSSPGDGLIEVLMGARRPSLFTLEKALAPADDFCHRTLQRVRKDVKYSDFVTGRMLRPPRSDHNSQPQYSVWSVAEMALLRQQLHRFRVAD
jgi:hypothetical protein